MRSTTRGIVSRRARTSSGAAPFLQPSAREMALRRSSRRPRSFAMSPAAEPAVPSTSHLRQPAWARGTCLGQTAPRNQVLRPCHIGQGHRVGVVRDWNRPGLSLLAVRPERCLPNIEIIGEPAGFLRTVASSLTLSVAISFGRKTRTVAEPRDELTSARSVVCGSPKSGPPQSHVTETDLAVACSWISLL